MLPNISQSSTAIDVHHMNSTNINTRNYLLFKPSSSFTFSHDLRLFVTGQIPSNTISSSSRVSTNTSMVKRRNNIHKKNHKQTNNNNIYESLVRSIAHCLPSTERDILHDNITLLSDSFTSIPISLLPNNGSIHSHNISKIQTYNINSNNKQKSNRKITTDYKALLLSSSADTLNRVVSTHQYNEKDTNKIITNLSRLPKIPTRKQLHVYIPQVTY
ncbi:unnamed protein product [Adineta steineri]|uniref:Uncharacterized protein n=1 Tax=Adineta steineri TaxID=433720 RepID=A0A815APN7_9BILA|nr:unnamed protein product [Adineta steineri]CAF3786868.1 unnamed protein product [Adineta steineri]